jgi:hypothetical protein
MDRHDPSAREILLYLDWHSHDRRGINDHRTVPPPYGTFSRDIPPKCESQKLTTPPIRRRRMCGLRLGINRNVCYVSVAAERLDAEFTGAVLQKKVKENVKKMEDIGRLLRPGFIMANMCSR